MREKLINLIIEAKRTDPETGSFTEYLADYLIENGVVIADEIVSKELYKQVRWERDVALKQLERIGVSLGEKTDDVVKVIRCGKCAFAEKMVEFEDIYDCLSRGFFVSKNDFCNYGKPQESEE